MTASWWLVHWFLRLRRGRCRSTIFQPGGIGFPAHAGGIPKVREAVSKVGRIIRLSRCLGTTLLLTRNGPVNGSQRKPNGSSPLGAVWKVSATFGATSSAPVANTWPTPGKVCFQLPTPQKTDLSEHLRSNLSRL